MAGRLEAHGPAPACIAFLLPADCTKGQVDARLPKYQVLATNLTQMVTAAQTLWNDATYRPYFNDSTTTLAKRLVWLAAYFCIGLDTYAKWAAETAPGSAFRKTLPTWAGFYTAFGALYLALLTVPAAWFENADQYLQDNDLTAQQQVPAEALLELVAQIYLNVYDTAHAATYPQGLNSPDLVQDCLREQLARNRFVLSRHKTQLYGCSLCIFVSQSIADAPNRNLCVGSTISLFDFDGGNGVFYPAFKALRQLRFRQGQDYAAELRNRFRDTSEAPVNANLATSPRARFESHGWGFDSEGLATLQTLVTDVTTDLTNEYLTLPLDQRKVWHSFSYVGQSARSNFAALTFDGQATWFVPTPRCMKCRVIHNYVIASEDLTVKARPNESCQCAEDICFGKLRQLNLVGNVTLANA